MKSIYTSNSFINVDNYTTNECGKKEMSLLLFALDDMLSNVHLPFRLDRANVKRSLE